MGVALALATIWTGPSASPAAFGAEGETRPSAPRLRILTDEPGIYRLAYEDLSAAGFPGTIESAHLALAHRDRLVELWVDDGGDGVFDAGDTLEFVAERLRGERTYYHEYSPHNVYWLTLDRRAARRVLTPRLGAGTGSSSGLRRRAHFEVDELLIRLGRDELETGVPPEHWYWKKLSHVDPEPVSIPLDLADLDGASRQSVEIRIRFMGLSSQATDIAAAHEPDHRVDTRVGGRPRGRWLWNDRRPLVAELPRFAALQLEPGTVDLTLEVPRREGADGEAVVDVVMLDWVEVDYPHDGSVGARPQRLEVRAGGPGDPVALTAEADDLIIWGDRSGRREVHGVDGRFHFDPGGDSFFWVTPHQHALAPIALELDSPSDLAGIDRQADYLMIAHHSLLPTARRLAEYHRGNGLVVALVDVQDVYDEFNGGVEHPRAIRDFIAHAYHNWRRPAPRYALLVGDASWDTKNATVDDANYANWTRRQLVRGERFPARRLTPYTERPDLNVRNLIPTYNYASAEGHSASDNWFVSVAGDDAYPELAIGRLPVVTARELTAVIDKSIAYASAAPGGAWRKRILWITNSSRSFARRSESLAAALAPRGFEAVNVFPTDGEPLDEHQKLLQRSFDEGTFLVHFVGHGGRFIWQTGPPNPHSRTDLFTLEHLDALRPTAALPVVLSLTCHTGPFDHPNADSIGERFLRLDGRGAVAVVAASWRNTPTFPLSEAFVDEFTRPGTIGDAFVRAKRRLRDRDLIETYNLLGDPALRLALPVDSAVE